eukprot:COSAG02_NODE_3392_length_6820_cov_6.539652_3_plen_55_part_00
MQVSEFFEPIGMFHRNFPWAHYSSQHGPNFYELLDTRGGRQAALRNLLEAGSGS